MPDDLPRITECSSSTIVFRADASGQIGVGHLMRCRAVAEELRRRGAYVLFVSRGHPGSTADLLLRNAFPVTLLPAAEKPARSTDDYQAWLGVPQAQDAKETIAALLGRRPDWIVVDNYALDATWEQALRPYVRHVLAIDDLANRAHDCDVLLDQNYSGSPEERYRGLVLSDCSLLLGPRYGLLSAEYTAARRRLRSRTGETNRVLVFFGGADPANMTGRALEALSHQDFAYLCVDVVVGPANPLRIEIEERAYGRPRTRVFGFLPHLADLMVEADLAVGAGGTTTWERLCLGLPALVVSIAPNQVSACTDLDSAGLVRYLGAQDQVDIETLQDALRWALHEPGALRAMCLQSQLLVDGLGALRVAELLAPTSSDLLGLRPAGSDDALLFFHWVNDPEVRRQSFNRNPISWGKHRHWFDIKLNNPACRMFVLEARGLPVGQIRFDLMGDEAHIDYSLDFLVRRRGWGARLIVLGAMALAEISHIYLRAEVKDCNKASQAVFERLGFERLHTCESDRVVFRSKCARVGRDHGAMLPSR